MHRNGNVFPIVTVYETLNNNNKLSFLHDNLKMKKNDKIINKI